MGIQKKKEEYFNRIYEQYKNLVMKIAVTHVNDYYVAQEICQQTFMEYYIHMENVEERLIKAWLMLVARNTSIDYIRKACNKYENSELDPENEHSMELIIMNDGLERVVNKIVHKDLLYKILDGLYIVNESWYEAIMAVSIENKPQDQVAKELGITLQILRARLYRARSWIRANYGDEYDEYKS